MPLLFEPGTQINTTDGITDLSTKGTYWEIVPKDQMESTLKQMKEIGWLQAIKTSEFPKIRDLYLWANCPSRSDGSYYLPLSKDSVVLDLGSGWGSYTFPISSRVKFVVASDSCMESLQFIALRARQDGIDNIQAVHIDPLDFGKLPFASNQFDSVIMNGVLEWVGSYLKKDDPKKYQEKCLKQVFNILKPGGTVYIGIENRYGMQYFLGAADDHLLHYSAEKKVAYTSILPRFIANLISKKNLGIPYRTYTHSLSAYKKMLRKAGFNKTTFYYPESGYRAADTRIIPINSCETKRSMANKYGKNRLFKIVSFFRLESFFCDSYFIIAEKPL